MSTRRMLYLGACILLLVGGGWYVAVRLPANAPWEESGTLVIITRAMPEPARNSTAVLGLGLGDIRLLEDDGAVRLALITKRILLDVQNTLPYELLRTDVGVGTYSGLAFSLKSPEFRNDWQQDTPPEHVSLVSGEVSLGIPFTVEADKTTVILLGFETLQAVRNRDDALVYLPVIHAEVRTGVTVDPGETGSVIVRDGTIVHSSIFGMDWSGVVRKNFRAGLEPVQNPPEPYREPVVPTAEESVLPVEEAGEETASTSLSTSTPTSLLPEEEVR